MTRSFICRRWDFRCRSHYGEDGREFSPIKELWVSDIEYQTITIDAPAAAKQDEQVYISCFTTNVHASPKISVISNGKNGFLLSSG